ncbi:uncharacterized protein A1O9_01152 [Exophiala aquamarina CBS 119918]|uniref:SWR1-complex protein 3 domain-containing protein n=1 Tax=Exophiala aquamarina CBS 119918 TaxID=1182545 RepID=A0A072Q5G6_9EURO|nr:uncharacterized protein A1O9_01152 [Exophiala aquamarina CBS 119918]KEF63175.1 hypothetical protein A1O9_01152 [Exophiala aquamarina CBS 119918]
MSEGTAQKRRLSGRDRRESTAKRRASSPAQSVAPSTPSASKKASTPVAASEPRQKRSYTKRASHVRVQTPASRSSPSVSVGEDVLPTKMAANKPLPTTKQKQPSELSLKEYQSISESAILAASLHRSRMQWLCDGILEKYWVKPIKRKGVIQQPPNNPDGKSMQKLGAATITIEPHTFDAVFYIVRDPATPQPNYPRHPNQHTPKAMLPQLNPSPRPYGMYPPPAPYQRAPSTPAPISRPPSGMNTPSPGSAAPPVPAGSSSVPPQAPAAPSNARMPVNHEPVLTLTSGPQVPAPQRSPPAPPTPQPVPTNEKPGTPSNARGSTTTDPVIQMLAARAASDSRLKELMKVVATSKASPEQLKEFQAHIDEFNEVIRKQESERSAKAEVRPVPKPATPPMGPPQVDGSSDTKREVQLAASKPSTPVPNPTVASPAPLADVGHTPTYQTPPPAPPPRQQMPPNGAAALPGVMHRFPPTPPPGPARPMSGYMGYPPLPAPPPRPEPVIKHIVLEITSTPSATQSACQDRWLFPEHSVLEIRTSGLEMLCSFLVERKGTDILKSMGGGDTATDDENGIRNGNQEKFSADKEYYQPVTMTIKVTQHKTIATIAQAAKPLSVVQAHMKDVMEEKQRAPVEYLVHHLPREKASVGGEVVEGGFVDSGVELGSGSDGEEDELKDVYGI